MYDIAVIGGGPAGLSAAIQARARNRTVLVVSGDDQDGPLCRTPLIRNYPGLPDLSGRELLTRFQAHADAMGAQRRTGRVQSVLPMDGCFFLGIGSDMAQARAVILATGVVWANKLPGEAEYLGAGVSYCATCDGMLYRGKPVAVVGKSHDAPAEANWLREIGCQVTYVGDSRPDGLEREIPFLRSGRLRILGERTVTALQVGDGIIPCRGVFILRPSLAPADLLPGLALEGGYLAVDRNMAASLPGVFAAGDCTGLPLQIAKAVGEGQIAGQRAAEYVDKKDTD